MNGKNVVCNRCHWVHFEVSAEYVRIWEAGWKTYWPTLDTEGKEMFGLADGPPVAADEYLNCSRCSNTYVDFRAATPAEVEKVSGCTISGILSREEVL